MTEEVPAGRLYIDVVGDTTGFRRDLQAKLETQTRDIRARVRAELDTRGLVTRTRAAARAASEHARVRARVEVRASQTRAELNRALREAAREARPARARVDFAVPQVRTALNRALRAAAATATAPRVRVEADLDRSRVDAALADIARSETRTPVDADTAPARRATAAFRRQATSDPLEIDVRITPGAIVSAGRLLTSLGKFPLVAGGIGIAAGAVTNLAGALFAATAAASQAVGTVGVLPGLVGTALQGISGLVAGFVGVGDAVKQLGKVETQGAATAASAADTRRAAAQRVEAAQWRVADAARAVADAQRGVADARRGVVDALRGVADAQRRARYAQEELTAARVEARERLRDLRLELRGAALDEEAAGLAVERAAMRLRDTRAQDLTLERRRARLALDRAEAEQRATDESATASAMDRRAAALRTEAARQRLQQIDRQVAAQRLDRREADLGLRRARYRLDRTREANADLRREYRATAAAGVEGSREVVAARRAVADAERAVADAQRGVADARQGVVDAQRGVADAQRAAARAQIDLTRAQRAGASSAAETTAATRNLETAMDNLSPAGRRFARFVVGTLQPRLRRLRFAVQTALLPPLQTAVTRAMPLLGTLQTGLVDTGERVGDLALEFADLAASPAFRSDVATIMASNNRAMSSFGRAGIHTASALRHVTVAAGPLLERFAAWTEQLAATADETARVGRESGDLAAFFDRAGDRAAQLGDILWDLGAAVGNVAEAAMPTGDTILDNLADAAERLRRWTASPEGQAAMRRFFEDALPVAADLVELTGELLEILVRLADLVGAGTLDGLIFLLDKIGDALEFVATLPGGDQFLTALFTVGGVLVGMGLLVGWAGKLVTHMRQLKRLPGIGRLFTGLGRRRRGVRGMAGDVDGLTGAVGRELPYDRQKRDRLGEVGDQARRTGDDVTVLGGDMDRGTRKSRRYSRALRGIGKALRSIAVGVGLGGLLGGGRRRASRGGRLRGLGRFARGAGGLGGIAALLLTGPVGEAIAGGRQSGVRAGFGGAVQGAGVGAGVGALVGSVVPVVGTAIGAAVGAAVGGLIGGLRRSGAWDAVRTWTVTNAQKIPGWVSTGVRSAGRGLDTAFDWIHDTGTGAFDALRVSADSIWDRMWRSVRRRTGRASAAVGMRLGRFRNRVVGDYRTARTLAGLAWDRMWDRVGRTTGRASAAVGMRLGRFRRDVVHRYRVATALAGLAWDRMWDRVGRTTDRAKNWVGRQLDQFRRDAVWAFNTAVRGIGRAWGRLGRVTKRPVTFIVNTVYNRGIRWVWNKVAGLTGLPKLPWARFAVGGVAPDVMPGYAPGRDRYPAMVAPGEAWMRPEWTRAVGPQRIAAWNHAARTGGVPGARRAMAADQRQEGRDRVRAMRRSPIDDLPPGGRGRLPGFAYGGVAPHVAAAARAVTRRFGPMPGGIGGVGPRPNPSDHPTGHALDFMTLRNVGLGHRVAGYLQTRAADLAVKYLIWRQQINTGSGWRAMADRGSPTANHMDHVHASFLRAGQQGRGFFGRLFFDLRRWATGLFRRHVLGRVGDMVGRFGGSPWVRALTRLPQRMVTGLIDRAARMFGGGGYDAGGYLRPGLTLARNDTREPERVLTPRQTRAYDTLVAEAGHGDRDRQIVPGGDTAEVTDLLRRLEPLLAGQTQPLVGGDLHLTSDRANVADEFQRALFELRRIRRGGVIAGGRP